MARLPWIASELGSATSFPKEPSYRRSLDPTRVGIQRRVHDDAVAAVVRLARPICPFHLRLGQSSVNGDSLGGILPWIPPDFARMAFERCEQALHAWARRMAPLRFRSIKDRRRVIHDFEIGGHREQ